MAQTISVANTGAFSQLISRDYKKVFLDEYMRVPEEYKAVAKIETMDGAYIREGQVAGLTVMQRRGEGEPAAFDNFVQGNDKTIYPEDFALAMAITEDMWDDDKTGHIKKAFQELGKASAYTRELLFWDLLNSGFVTTNRVGIDGLALFGAHTYVGKAGTYSNYAASGSSLTMTTLQAAMDNFEKLQNERGVPMVMKPRILVVPPELRWKAEELLKSEYNPEDANQKVNTVGNKGLQYMVGHHLSSTTAWFLLADKSDHDLRYIVRKPLSLKSYDDPDTGNAKFIASMRAVANFVHWRGAYGNAGA